jgi:hypothetical protein
MTSISQFVEDAVINKVLVNIANVPTLDIL